MTDATKIVNGQLYVPNYPVIPYIEGDGIGRDITSPSQKVIDAAVEKAYSDTKRIILGKLENTFLKKPLKHLKNI